MTTIDVRGRTGLRLARIVVAIAIAVVTAVATTAALQTTTDGRTSAKELFQRAVHEEDAAGNLKEAIALYQRVLASKPDRELAARAQLRMAVCYEKLGRPEARQALEVVARDYADQKEVAAQARARLTARAIPPTAQDAGLVARGDLVWFGFDESCRSERRPRLPCEAVGGWAVARFR